MGVLQVWVCVVVKFCPVKVLLKVILCGWPCMTWVPLINKLGELHVNTSQVWFADDATAADACQWLHAWWNEQSGSTWTVLWRLSQICRDLSGYEGRVH